MRVLLVGLIVAVTTLGIAAIVPAQTLSRKVIEVAMLEYKYEPHQIRFNEGDIVVMKLTNTGRLDHNISARYWLNIPLTLRGDARQGISEDRKWVALEPRKSGELEFVVQGRGSFPFLCTIFDHAARGKTGAFIVLAAGSP